MYCRTSSGAQRDAMTIGAQIAVCKRLVREHGLTPLAYGPKGDGWLIGDDGISGRLLAGRQLGDFIRDIEAGKVRPGYLVVANCTRLFRPDTYSDDPKAQRQSWHDAIDVASGLRSAGVRVLDSFGEYTDVTQEAVDSPRATTWAAAPRPTATRSNRCE